MERFYKIAILISIIFLILCLIGIGILMQYQNAGMKFPIHPNVCPDFWTGSEDGKTCSNQTNTNIGKLTAGNNNITLSTYSTICDKYKWATNNKINWDGVSNYNGCL
jgi:hypothetical protein